MMMKLFYRLAVLCWVVALPSLVHSQTLTAAEYFLGADPGVGAATPLDISASSNVDEAFVLSADGLPLGLQKLYLRVQQNNGLWSTPRVRFFYVTDTVTRQLIRFSPDLVAAEYFYNADPGPGKGKAIPVQKSAAVDKNWVASTEGLDVGTHRLYLRAKSADGIWGAPDTLTIIVNETVCEVPEARFTFDTVDVNQSIGLTDLSVNVQNGADYEWDILNDGSVESTSPTFDTSFDTRGIYPIRLTVTNPDGCSASVVQEILVSGNVSTTISLSANDSLTVGEPITLTAPTGFTYEWNTGATTQAITVETSGTYWVYLTADGITLTSGSVTIRYFEPLEVDFDFFDATSGLNNGAAFIQSVHSDGLPYSISWSTGSSDVFSLNGLAPGAYTVTVATALETLEIPFSIANTAPANNSLVAAEYFLENDPGPGNGTPISIYQAETLSGSFELNTTDWEPGLHKIYTRVKSASGLWSIARYRHFYVFDPNARVYVPLDLDVVAAEYFFDNDPGIGHGTPISVAAAKTIESSFAHQTSNLEPGLHTLYVRTQQSDGVWSLGATVNFFVIGGRFDELITFKTDITAAEYFFDVDPGVGKGFPIPVQKSAQITHRPWAAKTDGLGLGEHTLYLRTRSQDGFWNTATAVPFSITNEDCTPPMAHFAFDTVGVETLVGIQNLSTGLADSVVYAWDVGGDGSIESYDQQFDTLFAEKGVYPLKLTVINFPDSCFASVVRDIYITDGFPQELMLSKNDSLLVGDSIVLSTPNGFAYEWNNGATTPSITVKESGTYYAWLFSDGISFKSQAVTVRFFEPISANLVVYNASPGISNGTAVLQNISSSGLPYEIIWTNGITNETQVTGLTEGTYQVEVRNALDTILLTFAIATQALDGSEIIQAEYYFNEDPGPGNGMAIPSYQASTVDFDFSPDISGLPIGLHKLYLRVRQADGLWGLPKIRFFYVIDPDARVFEEIDRNLVGAEYFVDTDPGLGNGTFIELNPGKTAEEAFSLETAGLAPGLHQLYLRMLQSDGIWSTPELTTFYLRDTVSNQLPAFKTDIVRAEYFFDADPGPGNGIPLAVPKTDSVTNRPWAASVAGLEVGKHKLNIRVQNEDGLWNSIHSTEFFVYPAPCDLPLAHFSFDTVAAGTPVGLVNLSNSIADNPTFAWDVLGDGIVESTSEEFDTTFAANGVYPVKLTVSHQEKCFTSIVRDVIVTDGFPTDLILSDNDSLLYGNTLTITAPEGYEYEWNTGAETQQITVTESGTYSVYLTKNGLSFKSREVAVAFFRPMDASVVTFAPFDGLSNGAARLSPLETYGLPVHIRWSTGAENINQIQDLAEGVYSVQLITPLETLDLDFVLTESTPAESSILAAEYFIDTDPGPGLGNKISVYANPSVSVQELITFDDISEGIHHVYFRTQQDNGLWGIPQQKRIYIIDTSEPRVNLAFGGALVYAEYGLDSLPEPGRGIPISINPNTTLEETVALDLSNVSPGTHRLFVQTRDESGNWSFAMPKSFNICETIPATPLVSNAQGCSGANYTISVTGTESQFNWYSPEKELLGTTAAASRTFSNVIQSATYFVTQVSPEGCESALAPFEIQVNEAEIFAGPDVSVYSIYPSLVLNQQFPAGGVWSGSSFVSSGGIFAPSSAGLGSYTLTYTLDSLGCTLTDQMQVYVIKLNNDPPVVSDQVFQIAENASFGDLIGQIVAEDPDGDVMRFLPLTNDDTAWVQLDSLTGTLLVKDSASFDYESIGSFSISLQAKDQYYITNFSVTIELLDVNEAPALADFSVEIAENSPQGTQVATLAGTDPENDLLTYTITGGNTGGAFAILDNAVIISDSAVVDFETNPAFNLIIEVSDGEWAASASLTVNVLDINEAPAAQDINVAMAENPVNGAEVGTVAASDPDGDALTYAITNGNTGNAFAIGAANGIITVADSSIIDFETVTSFILTVAVSDGSLSDEALVTITIENVNEAPALADFSVEIAENSPQGTQVATLTSTDPENDPLTYTITGGNTGNAFTISDNAVIISDSAVVDFETNPVFDLTIEVSDGELVTDASLTVNILDINEAPAAQNLNVAMAENPVNGAEVGTLAASDPDGDALTYTITNGNTGNTFAIGTASGVITVADSSLIDFETITSFTLAVTVSDGNLSDEATVTITIENVNEAPALADFSVEIAENSPQGTQVATLAGTDPENDPLTYTITGGNTGNAFAISGANVVVNNPAMLDFETTPLFDLLVQVSDGTLSTDAILTVQLTDVPEGVTEADSLLLVAFYEQLGGPNWTIRTNWLQGPISTWFGVTVGPADVATISLPNNNLRGELPESFIGLNSLGSLNLSNNEITDIPDLTQINGLTQLNVSGNRLQFASLEPLVGFNELVYVPQKEILENLRIIVELGSNAVLARGMSGTDVTYSWFKNGTAFAGSGPSITITANSFEDEGNFHVTATSAAVPGLTLTSRTIQLRVSSLQRDRLALLAVYDSLGGANWNTGSNWPTTEITAWQGISIQNNRVVGINLANNNLQGVLPEDINDLLEVTTINLSGNQITGLPSITLNKLTGLNVSDNRLDFADLIPNMGISAINYANQKPLSAPKTETLPVGSPYTLSFEVGGAGNVYQWRRNNTVMTDASTGTLQLEALNYSNMGTYQLQVTNAAVPGLTLVTGNQTILATATVAFYPAFRWADNSTGLLTEGESFLFRIRQGPYDTTATVAISNQQIQFSHVVLGDYILSARTEPDFRMIRQLEGGIDTVRFIPTYYQSTIDNQEATPLQIREMISDTLYMQRQPPPLFGGDGTLEITVESNFLEDGDEGSRVTARRKVQKAGCSIRRFMGSGRIGNDDDYVLVAYLETDENGQVQFGSLPTGQYRLNIQYPGVPMDPNSFIDFTISEDEEQDGYVLFATITETGILVELKQELGFYRKYFKNLEVYPNPADHRLVLQYEKLLANTITMKVVTLEGKVVLTKAIDRGFGQQSEIDVSQLSNGIYLLHFVDEENPKAEIATVRFIVQHR